MQTQWHRDVTAARQALETVVALEAAVRRSVEELSAKDFRELARMGWEEVERVAEMVRERLAAQDALCESLGRRLEGDGAAANPELVAVHAQLKASLDDFEQRALYGPYQARLDRTPFLAARPVSDAEYEAAWSQLVGDEESARTPRP